MKYLVEYFKQLFIVGAILVLPAYLATLANKNLPMEFVLFPIYCTVIGALAGPIKVALED